METSSPTSTSRGHAALDSLDMCTMLTEQERRQLSLPSEPEPRGGDECWFSKDGIPYVLLSVETMSEGLDEVDPLHARQAPTELARGDHQALRVPQENNECSVYIGVGSDTGIEVGVKIGGQRESWEAACALADRAAPLVEAKLP